MINKYHTFRTDTKQVTENMQRDFLELTEKQEMVSVGELSQEKLKDYSINLFKFLEKSKKKFNDDFFIEVFRWHEIGDRKFLRYRFKQRLALPTPRPGRAYYRYYSDTQELDLLWDLPPKKACERLMRYKERYALQFPNALRTILDYYDGTLVKKADEINLTIVEKRAQ